ncbi:hypothetical protein JTE90_004565 [Oedothorax gibbosus]|uniref:Uncharacterized protein n=1 Tax=Oedothorax gibbosus TaxID=931172 RepID=A0AAV6UL25_9ARAC|nr:hypothetical protein JTE90_004565 [Oedothorax gibbosus]
MTTQRNDSAIETENIEGIRLNPPLFRMILSFITLTSVLLLAVPSWGDALSKVEFQKYLEQICFKTTTEPLINGQENPLAQTLENFIALAEKYEAANPRKSLKEELFYFIRNYTYDNIEYGEAGAITQWVPKESNYKEMNELWEPDVTQRNNWPDGLDPFSDAEKCSIFNMMSHSILLTARNTTKTALRTADNKTSNSVYRSFNLENQYPREMGVVSVRGTNVGVALGKVLMGMYVGMHSNRKRPITDFNTKDKDFTNTEFKDAEVDPLYILTLAEVIAVASWRLGKPRIDLAGDGHWVSATIVNEFDTKDVCPTIYKLDGQTKSAHSYSSARGAADGLILGLISKSIELRKTNSRLSQILRMYYGRSGISGKDEDLGEMRVSFCNRQSVLHQFDQTLKGQVLLYLLLLDKGDDGEAAKENTEAAYKYYNEQQNTMFGLGMGDIREYCGSSLTIDRPEDLPVESPLDVIALIDTSSEKTNILKQQLILGNLAKQMSLSYSSSRMTVLTDQKMSADANGKIQLVPIVSDNPSAACVACSVTQFTADETPVALEDEVIIALDQLLQAKKENETKQHGVNGKVVIYFNFKEDNVPSKNSLDQRRVDNALRDLHLRHQDTTMYALGKTPEAVKKFARDDLAFVMSAVDEEPNIIGKRLFENISKAPATLQYSSCEDGKGEKSAVYEDFVSPNSIQHWEMPAKYFLKSKSYKFRFDSQNGPVRVCHSRATSKPELQKSSCKDVTNGQPAEFINSNPCKGFNVVSCAPFYFSIMGINNTAADAKQEWCDDSNTENQCRTLDQIKFKVSHEGIRCSGSIGLVSTPLLLVVGIILLNIFSKKY